MRLGAQCSVILLDLIDPRKFVITPRVLFDDIFQREVAFAFPYVLLQFTVLYLAAFENFF